MLMPIVVYNGENETKVVDNNGTDKAIAQSYVIMAK